MKTTENKARAAEAVPKGLSPTADVTAALAGLMNDINSKLQQQNERLTMFERKTMTYGRPALSAAADAEAPHQKAFNAYLRSGDDDALRGLELEGKALASNVAADGG
ncbi:hypothetical protein ACFFUT_16285 [Pseudohalocynthiibacter aestuariivivens]|uniref:Phage major capsid protein n=1 Tax=Pseudohalocynthiibacter aestuariivivens TaxID=1591409 RepID=A0ABV5JIR3_9RHOB|nr:hypothetical protein [Pseudohalocynthiibacter aestuariivivens]